jgi:hypothetical protein
MLSAFGILGPIDRLLGSVKQSHPFFPKSLTQGFYWLYRSLLFRDQLQNLRRRHMLPYQWQQPTQVPRNLHLIHPKPHADKLLWQMQAQIRDQSDNPKQKRHGVRTPSSNRSLATWSLVTLPFVGFKVRFDSAKHFPELGCRQSCQVFDLPVMRAQEGFSYHLFPPLCCAWSAFQQTCKNDTTKTINCESTLIHQGLTHKEAQSLQQQRNRPITQAQQVEGNRQSLHPLGKVIPADPGRIHPKGVATAQTPIPPRCHFPMLGVPQRFGDFLHQTEVFPLTSWVRAGLRDLERIWLHRR